MTAVDDCLVKPANILCEPVIDGKTSEIVG